MTPRPDAVTTDAAPPPRCPGVRCVILQRSGRFWSFISISAWNGLTWYALSPSPAVSRTSEMPSVRPPTPSFLREWRGNTVKHEDWHGGENLSCLYLEWEKLAVSQLARQAQTPGGFGGGSDIGFERPWLGSSRSRSWSISPGQSWTVSRQGVERKGPSCQMLAS